MKDLKYLVSYLIPVAVIIGISFRGVFSYLTPVLAFLFIPIIETLLPQDSSNLEPKEAELKKTSPVFDWLLYLNIPVIYGILFFFLYLITNANLQVYEIVGLIFSVGIALGSNGINVAHELGHRKTKTERVLSKILLLPSLYMHFYIEHNFGHHIHAATKEDPASAKLNQSVYSFWFTSVTGQYINAWSIQMDLLKRSGSSFISYKNDMLWYVFAQFFYLGVVYFIFGDVALLCVLMAAVVGMLLLETINYIEHYGLSRLKKKSGRYERVKEIHSWNSNHILGRMMLYELTRHSDHHFRASKKYQLLDYHETSPQMPYGYPTSMVLALVPPLWFHIMNSRIPNEMKVISRVFSN